MLQKGFGAGCLRFELGPRDVRWKRLAAGMGENAHELPLQDRGGPPRAVVFLPNAD